MMLFVRRYAPFADFGGGFEGDVRTVASTASTATARTIGMAQFSLTKVEGFRGWSSGSTFAGAMAWMAPRIGRKFSAVKAEVDNVRFPSASQIGFTLVTSGSNPLVPGAPDIDTFVDFLLTTGPSYAAYDGAVRGDNFPNAEVFVVDDGGREVLLFDFRTGGGRTTGPMTRLFGAGGNQYLGDFHVMVPSIGPPPAVTPVRGT